MMAAARAGTLLTALLATVGCERSVPPFVRATDSAAAAPRWPADAAGDWLLAFLDIETTGLVPGYHEPVDVGLVLTDLEGLEMGRFFVRIQPQHPGRASEGARRVNAFDPAHWAALGALTPGKAVDSLIAFHGAAAGGRSVMLVAFNSWFDAAFLDHLFRSSGRSWRELFHYFVLDLPSMAWSRGHRGLTGSRLAEALGIADEPQVAEQHTGLTGAELNARLYRALVTQLPR